MFSHQIPLLRNFSVEITTSMIIIPDSFEHILFWLICSQKDLIVLRRYLSFIYDVSFTAFFNYSLSYHC